MFHSIEGFWAVAIIWTAVIPMITSDCLKDRISHESTGTSGLSLLGTLDISNCRRGYGNQR